MTGEAIKLWLCGQLRKAQTDPVILKDIHITNATGDVGDLWGLMGDCPDELFCDNNEWNSKPGLMTEIIGNMTLDIVIRSTASAQNRIIIECKGTTEKQRRYRDADSQYFLWLLTMTESRRGQDIRWAVLLAAPSPWFTHSSTSRSWNYLTRTYKPLGSYRRNEGFDITLGEIRCDHAPA